MAAVAAALGCHLGLFAANSATLATCIRENRHNCQQWQSPNVVKVAVATRSFLPHLQPLTESLWLQSAQNAEQAAYATQVFVPFVNGNP
jgi:hypothetical protein